MSLSERGKPSFIYAHISTIMLIWQILVGVSRCFEHTCITTSHVDTSFADQMIALIRPLVKQKFPVFTIA